MRIFGIEIRKIPDPIKVVRISGWDIKELLGGRSVKRCIGPIENFPACDFVEIKAYPSAKDSFKTAKGFNHYCAKCHNYYHSSKYKECPTCLKT